MWSTWGAALLLFIVTTVLRRHVAGSWDVVDPGSNDLGWYTWSLVVTTLSWQWWTALLLQGRERTQKAFLIMVALVIIENVLYHERGWTYLVYGTSISPGLHDVLYVVDFTFDITQGALLTFIAMVAAGRPITLLLAVPVVGLKVFADEVVPNGLLPIQTEIIMSVAILALYGLVGIALKVPMRLPRGPRTSREKECR